MARTMARKIHRDEKLDLRVSAFDKKTLQAAASIARRSVTNFVLESALARADETLAERHTFRLSADNWKAFNAALRATPRSIPQMQRLLREPGFFDAATER